ncbi:DhaKLM operon coactivator DhaQ [Spirochaetia bacterium]|nr:DhaKLM operon coactivator DhaQ [Spirochaetia bacterium]
MLSLIQSENERTGALSRLLDGIMVTQPGLFRLFESPSSHSLYRIGIPEDRVVVIVSGGGGCGPMFHGFVGTGLADAACSGDFDCAPSAYTLYEIAKLLHKNKGVLFIANNYTGDFLNNDMAQELLRTEGIDSRVCFVNDDIFSALGEPVENRVGMCGIGIITKIACAAADTKMDLDSLYCIVRKAADRLRSVTVHYKEGNSIEFGAGFSGEEAKMVMPYTGIDNLTRQIRDIVMKELVAYSSKEVFFIVNRMQLLTYLDGFIITESLKRMFNEDGYKVTGCTVGEYFAVFMGPGCMVSVLAMDDELAKYMPIAKGYDFTI